MKLLKLIPFFGAGILAITNSYGQANASINLLTLNGGVVGVGGTVDVQVTVGNTGPVSAIGVNKVRAQISIPTGIANAAPNAEQTGLPAGWTILTNTGGGITVCNGSDVIPVGEQRQVLIKIIGHTAGGPSTIAGQLSFGPGTGVCTGLGSLNGDLPADNSSQSTITVSVVAPVQLTRFSARLINCQPVLDWKTENEIDFDRFEIERATTGNPDAWMQAGTLQANANEQGKAEYNFTDNNAAILDSKEFLYRLKMIDKNGERTYSSILRVSANCKTIQVQAYPNPVRNGKLYISITGATGTHEAILQTITGQAVLTNKLNTGTNQLDLAHIADGVYLLNIKNADGQEKKIRIVVNR